MTTVTEFLQSIVAPAAYNTQHDKSAHALLIKRQLELINPNPHRLGTPAKLHRRNRQESKAAARVRFTEAFHGEARKYKFWGRGARARLDESAGPLMSVRTDRSAVGYTGPFEYVGDRITIDAGTEMHKAAERALKERYAGPSDDHYTVVERPDGFYVVPVVSSEVDHVAGPYAARKTANRRAKQLNG